MKRLILVAVSALLLSPILAAAQEQDYRSVYDQIYAPPGGGAPQYQQPNQPQYQQQQKSTYDMIYDQAVGSPDGGISQYDANQVPTLDVDAMNPPSQPEPGPDVRLANPPEHGALYCADGSVALFEMCGDGSIPYER